MAKDDGTGTAQSLVLIDNDRVRVTEWRFAERGDNTGWHRHEHDYVVVPLFSGRLAIRQAEGRVEVATLKRGRPYFREAGVEHDVASDHDAECAFIEIELMS